MNHLQHESSPYLRQHAHNPVDWYPWGEEALSRARKEDKPILVSIGYSTCHWCHVMERESFEDEEIAAYMNATFISIKIDREERPDLDQLYMEACEVLTGQAGWPLHVFLTPEGRPFYAGAYFPPEPQGRRLSWSQALQYAAYNFYENRQAVERQADRVQARLQGAENALIQLEAGGSSGPDPETGAAGWYHRLHDLLDPEWGGFGTAPKFPNLPALEFLLTYAWHSRRAAPREEALFSLDRLLRGGIYDQLGGGLARYAVDRQWKMPHFEKMLYDNALLVRVLSSTYRQTREERYARAIDETLTFVARELTSPQGAFYAALDADSAGEEGAYYVWTRAEIEAELGVDAALFCARYDVSEEGNWEGKNILWQPRPAADLAREHRLDPDEATERLDLARRRLLAVRERRPRPHCDEKIVLGWNALMISAYAHAFHALGRETYRMAARRGLDFLLSHLRDAATGAWQRIFLDGKATQAAFLSDYALLIDALIDGYSLDYDPGYLTQAAALTERVLAEFSDEEKTLFYFTPSGKDALFLRRRDLVDSETPSGNALMASHLQRLGLLFDRPEWRQRVSRMLAALRPSADNDPLTFAGWLRPLLAEAYGVAEIAVLGAEAQQVAHQIQTHFLPGHVLMAAAQADPAFPLLAGRPAAGDTQIYLCQDYTCRRPVDSVAAFLRLLEEGR